MADDSGNYQATMGVVAQAINTAGNAMVSGALNRRGEKFNREMLEKQRQWSLDDWNMQNAYNDPSAQRKRLENAGLNPHLLYGNGSVSATAGDVRSTPNQSAPSYKQSDLDIGSIVANALGMQQAQANIARTKAETRAIESRTVNQDQQNALFESIGIDTMTKNYAWATQKLEVSAQKESAEFNAWEKAAFNGKPNDDPNTPLSKAYRAGFEIKSAELENAIKLGDLRAQEQAIKSYQENLSKMGIDPNTPWYAKMVGALLMKAFKVQSLNDLGNTVSQLMF